MADSVKTLEERLRSACEEADALVWYFARHCPGGSDDTASAAYAELVRALSTAHKKKDEASYQGLMVSYHKLACFTFGEHEVHGKSILDTIRRPRTLRARLLDRRRFPVVLGIVFFGLALLFEMLDVWSRSVLAARGATEATESISYVSAEVFWASLLAPCIPLLGPVAWGALGACTALAKRVADRLSAMSFEENRMRALTARIFLGAALALVLDILVFIEGENSETDAATLGFGPIAGAFLAGLFVQHIYGALETLMRRVSRAISPEPRPGPGLNPPSPPVPPTGG